MGSITITGLRRLARLFRKESREAFDTNLIADTGKFISYQLPGGGRVEGLVEGVEYPEDTSESFSHAEHTITPEPPELKLRTGILDVERFPLSILSSYEVIDPPAWASRLFPYSK
jgi:hypothetical protein